MTSKYLTRLFLHGLLIVALAAASLPRTPVSALSECQKKVFDSGISHFNCEKTEFPTTCGSVALVGSENAEKVWNFFRGQGFEPWQAAGIMGNMMAESGLNPKRVQSTKTPEGDKDNITVDGKTGYGLVQWTKPPSRQQGLADLAQARGVISGDLGVQLEYIIQELEADRAYYLYDKFLASTTVEQAVDIILARYENPANPAKERPKRLSFARDFLTRFGSGEGSGGGLVSGGNSCGGEALDNGDCPTEPISASETVTVQGIRVHPCISAEVDRIITLAKSQSLNMSGYGWRDNAKQIELRGKYGCGGSKLYDRSCKGSPPVAVPGRSNHERGSAVDFTCNGTTFKSRSHPCFIFMQSNTSLKNLPSEPWHWSINGG